MTGRKPSAFHRIRENTSRRLLRFNLALVLLAASPYLGAGATESARQPENVRFVALGDMPYGKNKGASEYAKIRRLLMSPAAPERNLAFSFNLHLGDFQDGAARCRDAATHKILPYFESKADEIYGLSDQPVFYTPGDNDWTDCDRHAAGVFELDALDSLRASFYPPRRTAPEGEDWDYHAQEPIEIFGTTFKHPENTRWRVGKVLFATVHLVATRNGRAEIKKSRTQADIHKAVLSAGAREEAAYVWIAETLKLASGTAEVEAVIIAMHVDPDRTDHYADFVGDCPGAARAAAAECDAYVPQPVVFEKLLKTLNSNVETHAM